MAKTANNGRRKGESKHVRHYEYMLTSQAYRSLSCYARCLLTELGRRYNGDNNGDIPLSIREAAELLNCHKDTAAKAFRDLEDRGFIRVRVRGAFNVKQRIATTWILTEYRYDDQPPTKQFMKWKPAPEKQKPVLIDRTDGPNEPDRVRLNRTDEMPDSPTRSDRQAEIRPSTVLIDRPLFSIPDGGDRD
jgi:hypothetical protein